MNFCSRCGNGLSVVNNQIMANNKYICILQRGWIFVGDFSQDGPNCKLTNASCIRIWGTTKGIGELAIKGPLKDTELDPVPFVEFHELTIVAKIKCSDKWK